MEERLIPKNEVTSGKILTGNEEKFLKLQNKIDVLKSDLL